MAVFSLLQACPVDLNLGGISDCKLATWKAVDVMIDKLTRKGSSSENIEGIFQTKLENSLMRYSGYKRQGFGVSLSRLIRVEVFYGPKKWHSEKSFLRVVEKENGVLTRFVGVCGGVENISVNFLLEFGTKEDGQMKVEFKGALAIRPTKVYEITKRFSMTENLVKNWEQGKFSGKLTLDLTLNDEALNLIHQDNLVDPVTNVVSKLLETVDSTGDGIIQAKNRKRVRCHKSILISQNEVFKKMFKKEENGQNGDILKMNDMTEAGVRALLAYLYCRDIKDALKCSFTTWELVMAADKYEIKGLLESMKDVIMFKGNEWFSASAALCLWSFAKKRIDSVPEDDRGFKEILDKAVSALRSKPKQELEQCPEFKEMLRSTETAQELCLFFILNK